MNTSPVTSLIIASKDGGARLKSCLDHLQRLQALDRTEIILVDNGSGDGSHGLMCEFRQTLPGAVQVISEATAGNSAGRNAGIRAASAELLLFIDDDCHVSPSFVTDWLAVFASHPRLGYASGRILPFDAGNSWLGCEASDTTEFISPQSFFRRGLVQGSNMAFRRASLEAAGFFDPAFGAGTLYAGEEWDVALRASYAGWEGGYFPTPTVAHDHGRSVRDAGHRLRFYDYGAGAVYAKHAASDHVWPARRRLARDLWQTRNSLGRFQAIVSGYLDYKRTAGRGNAP